MSPIECPKCRSQQWHATGRIFQSRRNLPRAVVICDRCGVQFNSGLPKALDAAAAERGDCELPDAPTASTVPVPQPTLPIPGAHEPRHQGFVAVGELARRTIAADFRRRASGEKD